MRLGILIFSLPEQETPAGAARLEKEARADGHEVLRLYEPFFRLEGEEGRIFPRVLYQNAPLPTLDAIICRPNFIEEPSLHIAVVQALAHAEHKLVNGSPETLWVKNKLWQQMKMAEEKLPTPAWAIAHDTRGALAGAQAIGYPVMLKVAFGTHGIGVFYAADPHTLSPIMDYLTIRDGNPVIIQKFMKGENEASAICTDVRAFVVGDRVVAAMQRTARPDDVRANAAQNGTAEAATLTSQENDLAIRAAKAFGLDIAGVDFLRAPGGPLLLEINANPGFEKLEKTTGINVAKEIIRFVQKKICAG